MNTVKNHYKMRPIIN